MINFFFSELFIISHSRFEMLHLLFLEFQVLSYLVVKLLLNHRKASPCVFNFPFFLSSFYYWSSSWRLYMVVRQGFLSFFNCSSRFLSKLWSVKPYFKINMVLNTCFVLRSSSILLLHFEVQFFLPYLLRRCYAILDNSLHVSWFICCQEWHNTTSNNMVKELHSGLHEEEYLSSLEKNMCWAPCLF